MTAARARRALASSGFAELGPLLEADDLARLRAETEPVCEGEARGSGHGVIVHNLWRRNPLCAELVGAAGLGRLARALLGEPEVLLFQDHLIAKSPGADREIAWHQDYAYWPLSAPAGVTLWVAIDDADEENGCLQYIPGTHHLGERRPADFVAGAAQPPHPELLPLDAEARSAQAVAVPVAAGSALCHHPLVWHRSAANPSRRWRRAWSLTFVSPSVRWDPRHAPHPYLHTLSTEAGAPVQGFPRF